MTATAPRTRMRATIAVAAALLTITTGALATACSSEKAAADTPAYLFVFDGTATTMEPLATTGTVTTGDATATDAPQYRFTTDLGCVTYVACGPVTWFTDRPVRDSGTIDVVSFVDLWSPTNDVGDSFRADPPNVAIEVAANETATGLPETIIAEMSAPTFVVDTANDHLLLTATMTIVPAEHLGTPAHANSHLGSHSDTVRTDIPAHLGNVSVFVDDAGAVTSKASATTTTTASTGTVHYEELPPPKQSVTDPDDPASADGSTTTTSTSTTSTTITTTRSTRPATSSTTAPKYNAPKQGGSE